jgi:hypothetical protein
VSAESPDGETEVFVSFDPNDMHEYLCVSRSDAPPKAILEARDANDVVDGGGRDHLVQPFGAVFLFSPDGRVLYFTSALAATEDGAHAVDLATGKEHFITPGAIIATIEKGPYRGLLVSRSRETEDKPPHEITTKYFVVTPSGVRVRRLRQECSDSASCGANQTCVKAAGAAAGACLPLR